MTEKKANEILRTKYPEAEIIKNMGGSASSRISVVFTPNGKVYDYYANSYQQVLIKLGFNILYKHNVEAYNKIINQLKKEIEAGGEENKFHLFDDRDFIPFTEEEMESKKRELERLEKDLESAIVV